MKKTDILHTEISGNELCSVCSLADRFAGFFEEKFIKDGLAACLSPTDLKQIKYIFENVKYILVKFKKAAMYSDYELSKDSFDLAEDAIRRISDDYTLINKFKRNKRNPHTESLVILKALYLKIKEYAELYVDIKNTLVFKDFAMPEKTVLIGALRNPYQLKIALEHEFYHVPVSVVENDEDIKCVAIYQSKNLFSKEPGVKYYGKVIASKEMPRYEIKEIASDSDTMYYRFEIEKWKMLKNPIKADSLGEVATRTTLYQLMTAKKTSELHIESAEEYKIYYFMESYAYTPYTGEMYIDNLTLTYDGSMFKVFTQGVLKAKISNDSFYKNGVIAAKRIARLAELKK